jgi:hypothetical protein
MLLTLRYRAGDVGPTGRSTDNKLHSELLTYLDIQFRTKTQ